MTAIDVSVGPGGTVRWRAGALELTGQFPREGTSRGIELNVRHRMTTPRQLYVPHLSPTDRHVVGDAVFRAPAFIVADESSCLVLIPDLDDVARAQGFRVALDYDHERRTVTFGATQYRYDGHVFFLREPVECVGQRVSLRLHVLTSDRREDVQNPYGLASRWLWRKWGKSLHDLGGSQRAPLTRYAQYVVRWAFSKEGWEDSIWQSFNVGRTPVAAPVFIVDVTRHPSVPVAERTWREPRSVWNQAWFSTQRCANGLYAYARQTADPALEARARSMTRLALATPQSDGLFPAVVMPVREEDGWAELYWTSSGRRPASASPEACHLVDAAFTCQKLLEWQDLTGDNSCLAFVDGFVQRLVSLQSDRGGFPGWVEPDGRIAPELDHSAESAVAISLLFQHGAAAARAAALRGAAFLEDIIADARWEDFETYYSCAPWGTPGERVARNGVYKQNTLSIAWCAEAMLAAWRATGAARWLRLARRCLDELSLYQAVWDPPFLPAPAHGGFGVMNADSEWNDARQSLFAPLYLRFYEATGEREYFERGASALRASFSMMYCPENAAVASAYERRFPFFGSESYGFMMENQGHGGGDPIGTFTIFTWGNGAALASAALIRSRYGDVYLDTRRERVLPVEAVRVGLRKGRVSIEDPFGREELLVVRDDGTRELVTLRSGRGTLRLQSPRRKGGGG